MANRLKFEQIKFGDVVYSEVKRNLYKIIFKNEQKILARVWSMERQDWSKSVLFYPNDINNNFFHYPNSQQSEEEEKMDREWFDAQHAMHEEYACE